MRESVVVSVSDWGNWNEAQGLLLRHFIKKSNWKGREKSWQTIHVCHLVLPHRGCISLSASCSFSAIFAIVFQLGSKACRSCSEPSFLKAWCWLSKEPLVLGFHPGELHVVHHMKRSRADLIGPHVGGFSQRTDRGPTYNRRTSRDLLSCVFMVKTSTAAITTYSHAICSVCHNEGFPMCESLYWLLLYLDGLL